MITVIFALAFAGIMAMLVVYLVMANLSMKRSNMREKNGFYKAETALTEIRVGLQQDMAVALEESYTKVMEKYQETGETHRDGNSEITMDQRRRNAYNKLYLDFLEDSLKDSTTGEKIYKINKLRGYVDLKDKIDEKKESLVVTTTTTDTGSAKPIYERVDSGNNGKIILKNIRVVYVDEKGYAAIITTDISLGIPRASFPTPSTFPDLMNMVTVAKKGIICEVASGSAENKIQGNFYAGDLPDGKKGLNKEKTSIYMKDGAKLSISNSEKAVCSAEIAVGSNGVFQSLSGNSLWAQGLHLGGASEVSLAGRTFILDDLTVDNGSGSKVTLAGSYYGYGSKASATDANCRYKDSYQNIKMADISSAITINGKNTTLDLSGLSTLMLAGKNYIASSKLDSFGSYKNDETKDVLTGESITVKGTQLAYLVPDSLLGDEDDICKNPMTITEYEELAKKNGKDSQNFQISVKKETSSKELGGKSLKDIGVDQDKPIQKVFYQDATSPDGKGFVYFYLNFTQESKASDFMENYYNKNSKLKKTMDQYLSFYFGKVNGKDTGIKAKDTDTYLRYVVNGNVLVYDSKNKSGKIYKATTGETVSGIKQEQVVYQNSWYALCHKMVGSCDLLRKPGTEGYDYDHDEAEEWRTPFDNIIDEKTLVNFLKNATDKTAASSQTLIAHNAKSSKYKDGNGDEIEGSNKTLVIDSSVAGGKHLIVCTGDVLIKEGVTFQGIILAGGTITLESGAKIISNPAAVGKAFEEKVTENKMIRDFFYDGDKYAEFLEDSNLATDNGDGDSGIYEVDRCITYKNWKRQ